MTIERRIELEPIDSFRKAMEYDALDHRETNERFVDDLLAGGPLAGDVLDIGTGTALIPIELCRRSRDIRVMAIDGAWQMLDQARINIELEGPIERITLDLVDAQELIYPDGQFDVVLSNHTLHQFANPDVVLREVLRVTVPQGRIFFRDWMRPRMRRRSSTLWKRSEMKMGTNNSSWQVRCVPH